MTKVNPCKISLRVIQFSDYSDETPNDFYELQWSHSDGSWQTVPVIVTSDIKKFQRLLEGHND
jgi:hypothetical protein